MGTVSMPPGPPCLSALESPFLMAPGQAWLSFQSLLSEPFWTFLTTALVSRADPMCRPLSLVLYTHGLTYFSQICEVGTVIIPILRMIPRGSETVSHLPKVIQFICGRTRILSQLAYYRVPMPPWVLLFLNPSCPVSIPWLSLLHSSP